MISFDEAIELVRSVAKPLGTETVRLADAARRVLAAPVDRADRFSARRCVDDGRLRGPRVRSRHLPGLAPSDRRVLRRSGVGRDGVREGHASASSPERRSRRRRPCGHPGKRPARSRHRHHRCRSWPCATHPHARIGFRDRRRVARRRARARRARDRRCGRRGRRRGRSLSPTAAAHPEHGRRARRTWNCPRHCGCDSGERVARSRGARRAMGCRLHRPQLACGTIFRRCEPRRQPPSRARTSSSLPAARRSARRTSPRRCSSRLGSSSSSPKSRSSPASRCGSAAPGTLVIGLPGQSHVRDGDCAPAPRAFARRSCADSRSKPRCAGARLG